MSATPSISKVSKHNTNCCVYGCHSKKSKDRSVHFHYFPKENSGIQVKVLNTLGEEEEVDKRKAWEMVLLMGKPVTKNMRVCSKHFRKEDYCAQNVQLKKPNLRRFAVPSQNLPKRKSYAENIKDNTANFREKHAAKRQKFKKEQSTITSEAPLCENSVSDYGTALNCEMVPRTYDNLLIEEKVVVQSLLSLGNISYQQSDDKEVQESSGDVVTFISTIKEDKYLNSLTGISTFGLLNSLTMLIKQFNPDLKKHKLSIGERIVLVFIKLKMALKFNIISFLFKISPSLCKLIFVEYVEILSNILKSCIHWPSLKECQQNSPKCFNNLRVVLDCLEIPIEKPKCICCTIRTYSHYKGSQTKKIMTGVSPAGLITFLSKSYGRRSSDEAIFIQSNLISKLQPKQDSIMVGKGFLIDEICREHFIKLIRPHFFKNQEQFTESEARENVLIAKAKEHVECVIQRIRTFKILNTPLPNTLTPSIDDIMVVICGMVNLQNPVLAENGF